MRILNRLILFGAIMLLSVASYGQNKRVRGNYAGPAYAGLAVVIDTLGYTVVDSAATPAVQVDTTFEGALLQFDTLTGTWESVNRAAVLGYKEYVALLTQTGTDAPVATVLYNDLGGNVVWTRTNIGTYEATTDSLFTVNKTLVTIDGGTFINDGGALPLDLIATDIDTVTLSEGTATIEMQFWVPLVQNGRLVVRIRVYN